MTKSPQPAHHGAARSEVSDALVALLEDFYGAGPSEAKTYYHDDLVVCLLRGRRCCPGRADAARGRSHGCRHPAAHGVPGGHARPFHSVIEQATGRRGVDFMSGNQQNPDMFCEVFVVAPDDFASPDELQPSRGDPEQ